MCNSTPGLRGAPLEKGALEGVSGGWKGKREEDREEGREEGRLEGWQRTGGGRREEERAKGVGGV